jgi:hypothetical protein
MKTHELGRSGLVSTTDGMNGHFWREAVIRDTWMSAKCHSRRFYDVLVTSAFRLIPISQNGRQARRAAEASGARKPREAAAE